MENYFPDLFLKNSLYPPKFTMTFLVIYSQFVTFPYFRKIYTFSFISIHSPLFRYISPIFRRKLPFPLFLYIFLIFVQYRPTCMLWGFSLPLILTLMAFDAFMHHAKQVLDASAWNLNLLYINYSISVKVTTLESARISYSCTL